MTPEYLKIIKEKLDTCGKGNVFTPEVEFLLSEVLRLEAELEKIREKE